MKAWFLVGPNQFQLDDIAEPELKEGYVVAEVLTAQPSVTETIMVACEGDGFGIADRVKAGERFRLPGHELCARVIKTNPGSKFKVGDRVASQAKIRCEKCDACINGGLCENEELLGVTIEGIFAERVALPERGLIRVPDALTDSEAANIQPLADCVAAVDSVNLKLGSTVVVYGAGCLGMNTMQVARVSGAGKVIVVDIKQENLDLALTLGATHVINGLKEDPVAKIMEITNGVGAEVVFDAAGGDPKKGLAGTVALVNASKSVAYGGELLILPFYGSSVEFPIGVFRMTSKKLVFPIFATRKHLEHGAALIEAGLVQIAPQVSYQLEGIDKVPEVFEITGSKHTTRSIAPAQVIINK
jgi:threonine dehydrogenase-like Zn-dependent dehydrogenase